MGGGEHLRAVDADGDLCVLGGHLHGLGRCHVTQEFADFLQVIDVLLEALAALVESIAVQRQGGAAQMTGQLGVLFGRRQQLGRLFQRRLLQLQAQLLRALQQRPDRRL